MRSGRFPVISSLTHINSHFYLYIYIYSEAIFFGRDSYVLKEAIFFLYDGTPTFWQRGLWETGTPVSKILVRALLQGYSYQKKVV